VKKFMQNADRILADYEAKNGTVVPHPSAGRAGRT
jgi:hypothetical protein